MKKLICIALAVLLLFALAACKDTEDPPVTEGSGVPIEPRTVTTLPSVLNQTEYVLYQNIFFNDMADVMQFYRELLFGRKLSLNTVDNIHASYPFV